MLGIRSTGLRPSGNSIVVVVTNGCSVSTSSAVAVAANVHGQTSAGLNDDVVLAKILDGVCAVDALAGLAGWC